MNCHSYEFRSYELLRYKLFQAINLDPMNIPNIPTYIVNRMICPVACYELGHYELPEP